MGSCRILAYSLCFVKILKVEKPVQSFLRPGEIEGVLMIMIMMLRASLSLER